MIQIIRNKWGKNNTNYDCQTFSELHWVMDNDTIARPDFMIVCGDFKRLKFVYYQFNKSKNDKNFQKRG